MSNYAKYLTDEKARLDEQNALLKAQLHQKMGEQKRAHLGAYQQAQQYYKGKAHQMSKSGLMGGGYSDYLQGSFHSSYTQAMNQLGQYEANQTQNLESSYADSLHALEGKRLTYQGQVPTLARQELASGYYDHLTGGALETKLKEQYGEFLKDDELAGLMAYNTKRLGDSAYAEFLKKAGAGAYAGLSEAELSDILGQNKAITQEQSKELKNIITQTNKAFNGSSSSGTEVELDDYSKATAPQSYKSTALQELEKTRSMYAADGVFTFEDLQGLKKGVEALSNDITPNEKKAFIDSVEAMRIKSANIQIVNTYNSYKTTDKLAKMSKEELLSAKRGLASEHLKGADSIRVAEISKMLDESIAKIQAAEEAAAEKKKTDDQNVSDIVAKSSSVSTPGAAQGEGISTLIQKSIDKNREKKAENQAPNSHTTGSGTTYSTTYGLNGNAFGKGTDPVLGQYVGVKSDKGAINVQLQYYATSKVEKALNSEAMALGEIKKYGNYYYVKYKGGKDSLMRINAKDTARLEQHLKK